ncbi:MAG: transcription-repair coupling factor, partial [Tissierellia bacterium]|nr:transcription-repair coupling factor [Tissierellia bacterium]
MNYLVEPLKNLQDYKILLQSIDENQSPIYLNGLIKESLGHFIYSIYNDTNKVILAIAEDEIQAKTIYEAISSLDSDIVEYYPAKDINYYNIESIEDDIEKSRIRVMSRLIKKDNFIIVTTPFALQRKIT